MKELVYKILHQGILEKTPVYLSIKAGDVVISANEHQTQYLKYQYIAESQKEQYHSYNLAATFSTYSKPEEMWEKTPGNLVFFNLEVLKNPSISFSKRSDERYLIKIEGLELNFLRAFKTDPLL